MWLLNVVVIVTFIYYIVQLILKAAKQKDITLSVIIVIALIFEGVFVFNLILGRKISNTLQAFILIFSYIIPLLLTALGSIDKKIRLGIVYEVAKLAYSLKRYEFAEGMLLGAIKNDKRKAKYYYLRGRALEKLNRLEEARDMLFSVVELDKKNKEAYLDLANILDKENKKDTALVMIAQALKIDPNYDLAKEMIGIIYSELGRDNEAKSIYEELSQNGEGSYNTYYNLGIIYWKQGKLAKAILAYEKVVAMNPKLYEAYYSLGRLYFNKNELENSIINLKKAEKDKNIQDKVYYSLALAYAKKEELDVAEEYLEKAINLNKEYLAKAKNEPIFENLVLDINRIEDENKELVDVTYELENDVE